MSTIQLCLVSGIPTLAAAIGIAIDRLLYKTLMARLDSMDGRFRESEANLDIR
jgi:hypothetical protein